MDPEQVREILERLGRTPEGLAPQEVREILGRLGFPLDQIEAYERSRTMSERVWQASQVGRADLLERLRARDAERSIVSVTAQEVRVEVAEPGSQPTVTAAGQQHTLSWEGLRRFARRLGLPEELAAGGPLELVALNVNYLLEHGVSFLSRPAGRVPFRHGGRRLPERLSLLLQGRTVTDLLTDEPLRQAEVIGTTLDILAEKYPGLPEVLDEVVVDDDRVEVRIPLPGKSRQPRVGDTVNGRVAITVETDDSGQVTVDIDVDVEVVWCSNGATRREHKHIRVSGTTLEEVSEQIRQRLDAVLGRVDGHLDRFSDLTHRVVGPTVPVATSPDRWFETLAREFDLPCEVVRRIREAYLHQRGGDTEYDLINAVTQAANDMPLPLRRRLQEIGGELIARGGYRCPMCLAPLSQTREEQIRPEDYF